MTISNVIKGTSKQTDSSIGLSGKEKNSLLPAKKLDQETL